MSNWLAPRKPMHISALNDEYTPPDASPLGPWHLFLSKGAVEVHIQKCFHDLRMEVLAR